MKYNKILTGIYTCLYLHFGPQDWWPADTQFEVMIGAILTQNTAWANVEKAIYNLKRKKVLSIKEIKRLPCDKLAKLIRPSGFYNQKAKKIKNFLHFLLKICGGSINKLHSFKTKKLRNAFLEVNGIGKETADSILLYALSRPIFVVDAYTKRIFTRHKLVEKDASYDEIQMFFMKNLPKRAKLFNEYHALIVAAGKKYCKKKKPLCKKCPLRQT
ncbi:MAG: endonuclease III domain-containing protein [Candidatus Omnitrophota bacterium]